MAIFPSQQSRIASAVPGNAPVRAGLKFSQLKLDNPTIIIDDSESVEQLDPTQLRWSAETGRSMIVRSTARFSKKVIDALHRWPIGTAARNALHGMIGRGVHPVNELASNMALRVRVGDAFAEMANRIATENPDLQFFFATIIDDKARTFDRTTVVDLGPLKKRVRKILESAQISDWFGIIEFEGETMSQRGKGRPIIPHAHVLFWLRAKFQPKKTAEKLSKSQRLKSQTNAPTVVIRRRRTPGSVAYTCNYVTKAPKGSNLVPCRKKPGEFVRREAELRPNHALRIIEVLSQYNLAELFISGGKGKRIRKRLVATVIRYRNTLTAYPVITRDDTPAIWLDARHAAGRDAYGPVRVIRSHPR